MSHTIISINGIELLAVEVPEDCKVKLAGRRLIIHKRFIGHLGLKHYYEEASSIYISCAPWQPLGLIKDISEQVAATLVEDANDQMVDFVPHYKDYCSESWEDDFATAKESLSSLIKSKGLDIDFTYLLKLKK